MRTLRTEHFLVVFLVISLSAFLLAACDDCKAPGCDCGNEGPDTVTISGKVYALTLDLPNPPILVPVPDATVELEDGSNITISGEDGSWTLEGVPVTDEDPMIKITSDNYPTTFNSFPLTLGIVQYDLQTIDQLIYDLLLGGAGPDACLVLGVVVGIADYDYPQEVHLLEGATISVTPATLDLVYINDFGQPDPSMTETGSGGSFTVVVPDATAITSISLSGTRPGSQLVGAPSLPTRPGAYVLGGLIDMLFTP